MAKDKEKTEKEGEKEGGGGPSNLLLIIIIVMLAANTGLTAMVFLGSGGGGGEEEVSDEPGPLQPLEPFVINLDEPGADRYLRVKISVELDEEASGELVTGRMAILRDRFLSHLASQQLETLKTKENKEQLREELTVIAQNVINEKAIRNVYFTEFIIQ